MTGKFNIQPSDLLSASNLALQCELFHITKHMENKYYWTYATYQVDKVKQTDGVTLYWVRLKGMKKKDSVILQSDWTGMEHFTVTR